MLLLLHALCLAAVLFFGLSNANPTSGSSFGVPGINAVYDYVVVGGGTAGLTVASRLVEQEAGSVAVIEAGTFYELSNGNLSQLPGTSAAWTGKSPLDWQPLADWGYITAPQEGSDCNRIHYPQGKMLGGSSGRNFLIYQRGTQSSYQKWADAVGDETYTFENFLPYFEKSLKFTPPNNDLRLKNATPEFSTSALGTGNGPLSLSFPNWAYAFGTWATTAFSQIGIPLRREGFQNGGLLGHAYTMFTQNGDDMQRSSSETAFLRKALGNPNYYVYPLTMAKRILFDDDGGNGTTGRLTATGVVVETAGAEYAIAANREVILSAGVFGSPQLLQVSGIGPRDLLEPLGIPVMVDLPGVGQNMQDHIFFGIARGINAVTTSALGDPVFIAEQHRLFAEEANGLLTSSAADVLAWEKLPGASRQSLSNETKRYLDTFPEDWPDVEYVTFSAYLGDLSMPIAADPHDGTQYATVAAALAVPRSRGSVNITSSDVSTMPVIDPRFLTEKADMEVAVAGFRRMREFWNASSIEPLLTGDEAFPGVSVTDEYDSIEAWIRKSFMTVYHGSCTCAMGKASDPYAVVDPQGRVYNVDGLRVVDASAFPLLPPGHIQSTVYALAEKIACDISSNCK